MSATSKAKNNGDYPMQSPKALYICHSFHSKTLSNTFLSELIATEYELSILGVDPDSTDLLKDCASISFEAFDLIILFQVEFLLSLVKGRSPSSKVLCVPMYDACGSCGDTYFQLLKGSMVLNFSSSLHLRCKQLDILSCYWKYYPKPLVASLPTYAYKGSRGFLRIMLWIRRPSDINIDTLFRIFPCQLIDFIHIHWSSDSGESLPIDLPGRLAHLDISHKITTWFSDKSDYIEELRNCNIFLAPRYSEGIGQGFLDAMANGLAVVAYDLPTHSEYIVNWVNGILFNNSCGEINISKQQLYDIQGKTLEFARAGHAAQKRFKKNFLAMLAEYMSDANQVESPLLNRVYNDAEVAYCKGYVGFLEYLSTELDPKSEHFGDQYSQYNPTLATMCHRLIEAGDIDGSIGYFFSSKSIANPSATIVTGRLALMARLVIRSSGETLRTHSNALISEAIKLITLAHLSLKERNESRATANSLLRVVSILNRALAHRLGASRSLMEIEQS
jgi:hypothetical protein